MNRINPCTICIYLLVISIVIMPTITVQARQETPQEPSEGHYHSYAELGMPRSGVAQDKSNRQDVGNSILSCAEGTQDSGALYQICVPDAGWNGTLIVWSHGYVPPGLPLTIRNMFGDLSLPDTLGLFGYAFATTSFSKNGLAIRQGMEDLVDLVAIFNAQNEAPTRTYIMGVSLGAATSTLTLEENADKFDGGIAMCGPYGDFQRELDYLTDTRVLFDYFFPDLLPGTAVNVPQPLIADWENVSNTTVVPALASSANVTQVNQLLSTSQVAFDTQVPTTTVEALINVLSLNVLGSNDGVATLGGQPYDNRERTYMGSLNDDMLNQFVTRFAASQAALDEVAQHYETDGQIQVPLVMMHTTLDPVMPYWHATDYQMKVDTAGRGLLYMHQAFERYGHCQFTQQEILGALTALNQMVDNNIMIHTVNLPLIFDPATQQGSTVIPPESAD